MWNPLFPRQKSLAARWGIYLMLLLQSRFWDGIDLTGGGFYLCTVLSIPHPAPVTFRAMFRAFLFLALCVCITMLLNYAPYPSQLRKDSNLHNP